MCKVMQLYGMSANEIARLSDAQIENLVQHADAVGKDLVQSNPAYQQAVSQKVTPVLRSVRSAPDGSDSTPTGPPLSSNLGKLYNLSITDMMRLSPGESSTLDACGATQAQNALLNSPGFLQALQQKLSPAKRAVRNVFDEIDSGTSSGGATPGNTGSGGTNNGGGLGPPPGF